MVRRTNKSITETLSSAGSAALSSKEDLELQRKITIATEGFGTTKFCELILRDRTRTQSGGGIQSLSTIYWSFMFGNALMWSYEIL
jgi:hypothetical protein